MISKALCALLATTMLLALPIVAMADNTPLDLSTWSPVSLQLPNNEPTASWEVASSNTSVTQTVNANPSFYLNNLDQTSYVMNGMWQVTTSNDDDFIGFVFGYQDPSHYYIMDWKQSDQSHSTYGTAREGFRIYKIDAPSVSDLRLKDFWSEFDTPYKTVLASHFGSTLGWADGAPYTFRLVFEPGVFTVTVKDAGTILWETTVLDGTYSEGQFGFYNCSQGSVRYSGFVQNDLPVCDAGGPYVGSAGQPVNFDASGSFDPDGDIVSYEWNFGDGSVGTGVTTTHTYTDDGEYLVILCVTDDIGARQCCESGQPAVPTESSTWGTLKSLYD